MVRWLEIVVNKRSRLNPFRHNGLSEDHEEAIEEVCKYLFPDDEDMCIVGNGDARLAGVTDVEEEGLLDLEEKKQLLEKLASTLD